MELVDTHAHLDMPEFQSDLLDVLQRAAEAGVGRIICVGTTLDSCQRCVQLARRYPGRVFAAVGIHPNYCAEARADDFEQVEAMASLAEVVAVGETGLDLHHSYSPPELQGDYLRRHIRLSLSVGKPLIVHARKADEQLLRILGEQAQMLHGVRHCFDGSAQTAARYLDLGFRLGFGGAITQPGHKKLKAAARMVPAARLLVETDCPYMTPAGQPGGRNEPAFITHAVQALAGLRKVTPEEIARITTGNAARLFFGGGRTEECGVRHRGTLAYPQGTAASHPEHNPPEGPQDS